MANPIDIIVTQDALKGVDAIIARVDLLDKKLADVAQNVIDSGKKIAAATNNLTPTAVSNKGADSAKLSADLDALKAKYVSLNDTIQKKAEQTRLKEIQLQQQREKAFDSFERNAKKEQATIEKNNSLYNKTQQQINNITKAYNDLAVKKERYNNLTVFEENRLKTLQAVTEKYNGVLKTTDAQIGKNGRNVGNYSSSFNSLGNSINQLTREAPAFAVSLNTGFLALSNNIPILTDEIIKLKNANVELAKSGQPTKSVIGQLLTSFLTWQTAISLGVTLLTLYGGTLIDSITGSKKKKEALEAEKKALEEKTQAEQDARDAIAQVQAIEVSRSQILFETAKNLTLSYKQRTAAVKELQERYPDYLGHLSKEQILAGDTAKAEEDLNQALINRGKALAAQKFLQTNLEKQLSAQIELTKANEKKFKLDEQADTQNGKIVNGVQQLKVTTDLQKQAITQKRDAEIKANNASITGLNERLRLLRNEQDAFLVVYNENAKYLDVVHETTKALKEQNREKTDSVGVFGLSKDQDTALERLKQLKQALEITRDQTAKNVEEYQAFEKSISDVNKAIDILTKPITVDVKILGVPEAKSQVEGLTKSLKDYFGSFSNEFASNSGFSETFNMFFKQIKGADGEMTTMFQKLWKEADTTQEKFAVAFNSIAESSQEAFNFISEASTKNFDGEKERLQAQYDISLKYAGDNKAAQEKLAEDLEKKKKDIDYREAKAKQKQALFNIAIDTAQAVISAVAESPLTFGLPWSAFALALGVTQAALVSSQEIPRYWMGGTHEGGLMMVNDGGGSKYKETVVTPDGKIMKPQGKNVIMNAPAGTEIYTNSQWSEKLSEMLQGKGIDMAPVINNNSGLSKSDMYDVMMDAFGSQPQHVSNFDAQGATEYITRNGNKTILNRNRSNGKGQRFR